MEDDYRGFAPRPVESPEDSADIEATRKRLRSVPDLVNAWTRVRRVPTPSRSELAQDDQATDWLRISQAADYAMMIAADALHALARLFAEDDPAPLPLSAHYSLARSGLEAASLALWILGPDDPKLRIERHLRNAVREMREEDDYFAQAFDASSSPLIAFTGAQTDAARKDQKRWRKKRVTAIQEVADRMGVDVHLDKRVSFAEIVRDATRYTELPGGFGEFIWRTLSGLTHPSLARATSAHHTKIVDDDPSSPIVGAVITSKSDLTRVTVDALCLQFVAAVEILRHRKLRAANKLDYTRDDLRPSD